MGRPFPADAKWIVEKTARAKLDEGAGTSAGEDCWHRLRSTSRLRPRCRAAREEPQEVRYRGQRPVAGSCLAPWSPTDALCAREVQRNSQQYCRCRGKGGTEPLDPRLTLTNAHGAS